MASRVGHVAPHLDHLARLGGKTCKARYPQVGWGNGRHEWGAKWRTLGPCATLPPKHGKGIRRKAAPEHLDSRDPGPSTEGGFRRKATAWPLSRTSLSSPKWVDCQDGDYRGGLGAV